MDIAELERFVEALLAQQASTEKNARFFHDPVARAAEIGRALGYWGAANLLREQVERAKKRKPSST